MHSKLRLSAALLCFACLHQVTHAQTNTATGVEALQSNTSGTNNTATGYRALRSNIAGVDNTAHGANALSSNTSSLNTATGAYALSLNTTGFRNTAHGANALLNNKDGLENTADGANALLNNSSGSWNTASGAYTLFFNSTGSFNTASGYEALRTNNGSGNTAYGVQALARNISGGSNTATGYQALFSNSTGLENVATGYVALRNLRAGFFNTATGDYALYLASETYNNTATGGLALAMLTTGHHNTALGKGAGYSFNTFGSTFVGADADATTNVINSTALGYRAMVTADNQVRIGNTSVTSIGGEVNWTAFSDGRFKKNTKEDVPGLSFITKLRPVTYTLDVSGIDNRLKGKQLGAGVELQSETAKLLAAIQPSAEEQKAKAEKAKVVYTGFVAQEVEAVAKELNYDFSGVDKPKNKGDFYGLRYGDFVVPLVKSVQELDKENKELRNEVNELKEMVTKLLNGQDVKANNTTATISGAYLKQNIPNPHRGNTVIQYHLPQGSASAQMLITNSKGQVLKTIALNSQGQGQLTLNAGTLPAGTYTYSLLIDGRQADSKQMVVLK